MVWYWDTRADISFDRRHHNNVWTCKSYGGINQPYGVSLGQENLRSRQ